LINYYDSPIGRKVTAKMGEINQFLNENQGRFADLVKDKLFEQLKKDGKIEADENSEKK
jgi:hypothetical protein